MANKEMMKRMREKSHQKYSNANHQAILNLRASEGPGVNLSEERISSSEKTSLSQILITLAVICFLGCGMMVLGVLFDFPGFTHPTDEVYYGIVMTECTPWAGWTTFGLLGLAVSLMSVGLYKINPLLGIAWVAGLGYIAKKIGEKDED